MKLFSSVRYLLFLLVSVLICLIALELILRFFRVRPDVDFAYLPDYWTDQKIPGIFAPSQIVHDDLLIRYTYRVNNQGLRGEDVDPVKQAGELRILVLGDSAGFGFYVKDNETFPARLEELLRKKFPDRTITVLNAGCGGYTIKDEWLYVKSKGIRLNPDLVIVAFYSNDVFDLNNEQSMWEGQRRNIVISWQDWWFSIGRLVKQTSICKHALSCQVQLRLWFQGLRKDSVEGIEKAGEKPSNVKVLNQAKESPEIRKLWQTYRRYLETMKEFLDSRQVKLMVLAFADHEQLEYPQWSEPQETLANICAELGIPFVDVLPSVRSTTEPESLFLLPKDTHPSAKGYQLAAEETVDPLVREMNLA